MVRLSILEERYKQNIALTNNQKEIIVGTLIGDGHLESIGLNTARLKIEHSISQAKYVDWLYEKLANLTRAKPSLKRKEDSLNYYFQTYSLCPLKDLHTQFYCKRRKTVPPNIVDYLTPLGIAVWFMDDGSVKSKQCRGRYLNTQGYTLEEIDLLREALRNKFGIHTTIREQKDGLQIYIPSNQSSKLTELIGKYIIDSMRYKL